MKDKDIIAHLIRPEIRALKAYHVPDASGLIKLDAMENPYSWPAPMKAAWLEVLRDAPLNRYPDPEARAFVRCSGRRRAWTCCSATAPMNSSR